MRLLAPGSLLAVAVALIPGAVSTVAVAPLAETPAARVVAIGDIHGAYGELVDLLSELDLIDDDQHWNGGAAVLVQTGDILDRGPGVRAVMDLLMRLQAEAANVGGRVIVLLGNHEAMNLIGQQRDVTHEIYATFAGDDAEGEREAAYRSYERNVLRADRSYGRLSPSRRRELRANWMRQRPVGFVEYQAAIGPDGVYGGWLRTLPLAARVGGVLYMHAGISPRLSSRGLEAVIDRVAGEVAALDRYRRYLLERRRITAVADIAELIAGAALEAGGLEWLPDFDGDLLEPPPLPSDDLLADDHRSVRDRLLPLLRLDEWYLLATDGPLWFRGWAQWDEARAEASIDAALEALGVRAMVSGHTPQAGGIRSRLAGRVVLIDAGMLQSVYQGRVGALEITAAGAMAVYADGGREPIDGTALVEPATEARWGLIQWPSSSTLEPPVRLRR